MSFAAAIKGQDQRPADAETEAKAGEDQTAGSGAEVYCRTG